MARKQIGTNYLVFANTGTDVAPVWKAMMCQTSVTGNFPTQVIDATSKCGPDAMLAEDVVTFDLEGQLLQKDVSDTTRMTAKEIHDMKKLMITGQQPKQFKLAPSTETSGDDGKIIYTFNAVISNLSDTFGLNEVATQSMTLQVKGDYTVTEYAHP